MAITTTSTEVVSHVPFLLKKWEISSDGADAANLAHGEGRTPTFVWITGTTADPTGHETTVTSYDATNIAIDFQLAGTSTHEVLALWVEQSDGGIALPG